MPVVMTRIIQKCFLVLAFTGILLSCAQESTVSDPAPFSNEQTPSSAPEISYTSVATNTLKTSSHTDGRKSDTSDFRIDNGSQTSNRKIDVTLTEESKHDSPAADFENSSTFGSASSNGGETTDSTVELTTKIDLAHSRGLFRAELQDDKPTTAEVSTEKLQDSSAGEVTTDKLSNLSADETTTDRMSSDPRSINTSESYQVSRESPNVNPTNTSEEDGTIITSSTQSTKAHSLDNSSNDSRASPVPLKGDAMSNSSDLGLVSTPEKVFSTTPSKVQTEDGEGEDNAKSATRKRSLNATNTLTEETTVTSSGQDSSSHAPVMTEAKADESVTHENGDVSQKMQTAVPPTHQPTDETETVVSSTAEEITKSPYTINGASVNPDILSTQDTPESKTTSASLHDAHQLSISSAALTSFSEESIHPSENTDTTAQISNVEPDATTNIATSSGSRELEDSAPVQNSDSPFSTSSSITFDPNGMTHNYSQEPDSVTFPSQVFHVDGMPSNPYLSQNGKYIEEINESTPDDRKDVHSSELEREGASTPPEGSVERENPDAEEEMSSKNTVLNTNQPMITPFSTVELFSILSTGSPGKTKDVNAGLTDESEEMLNDSPDFEPVQSKSTVPTMTNDVKHFMNKYLEMNVSNDISHTTGASSQLTSKAAHELEFSIDYQPEQSEFRPVTVTSPLGTPEPATIPPGSLELGSKAPNEVTTTSGQPDTINPDASSPTVLPNPAPSVVNQSTEETIGEASNGGNVSTVKVEENLSNSSIAGVAVKTSVSVSLPLSKLPNGTSSLAPGEVTSETVLLPNITEIILPIPIHVNKDVDGHPAPTVISTEASTEASTVSTGLRIRKPKLKIGGGDASEAPRTRKPFLAPPPKSSSTVGPPVSIFKNARTRMASITSSTTARPFPQFSTIRIHYASRLPGIMPSEHVFTLEPTTTTEPTTTETEEPFSDDPFTEPTQAFSMPSEDVVTIVKIAGYIVVDKGLRWEEQLNNRHSPEYKKKSKYVQVQIDRLFRTSGIGSRLWKTEIDGFSGKRKTRSVAIDFFLYIAKSPVEITTDHLRSIFHDKLVNNTFNRFTVDPSKTSFEILNEEPLRSTTEAPETEPEPVIPQWAIAVIVVGAASLIFIVLFAVVAILGRHHMRRRYSNKLNDEDSDRPSDWESKMAAAYENLAADTIYDAEDLHSDTYKKKHNSTFHGRPTRPQRADSWSSSDWSPPPRRPRPQVHRIVY